MKKLLLSASIAALFSFGAFAAKTDKAVTDDSKNISYFVLNQFNADFSNARDVVWTITPSTQKADFTIDGVRKTAFYIPTGTYLGLTQQVAYKSIPLSAQNEITGDYKDYTVGQVIRFEASDENVSSFYRTLAIDSPEKIDYFVDLKKAGSEILVRVTEHGSVFFFKQVK